jgi:hypothetical protein
MDSKTHSSTLEELGFMPTKSVSASRANTYIVTFLSGVTMAYDESGRRWLKKGPVDLSKYGFTTPETDNKTIIKEQIALMQVLLSKTPT